MKRKIEVGDIYAQTLPNGRYGAVRVINQIENSNLVVTTPYIGTELPNIKDEILMQTLYEKRFFNENLPALRWVDGRNTKDSIYIGNKPLTDEEKNIKCNVYSGKWSGWLANLVFYEWRWEYDRENFEEEIREEQKKQTRLNSIPQKPKKMMEEDTFWSIVEMIDIIEDLDEEEQLEPAVQELAKMKVKDIKQFEETLSYKLYLLDTKNHAENTGDYSHGEENKNHFSPDLFLYTRCYVVSNGKAYFELVLNKPQVMPKEKSFEPLLTLASRAYKRRMGKDFEYYPGCDYETFSNIKGWE
jgi:hypothetical protein